MKNIWLHNEWLPDIAEEHKITLGESHTPLIKSAAIGKSLGVSNLYFKLENINPTGSYKDRFAAVLVSWLKERGSRLCLSTSSGNTGAALAAYCAAARIPCCIAVVDGAPLEKILQMQLYGADVCMIRGFGKDERITSDVFARLGELADAACLPLPISAYKYCSLGMQGVQTIASEIMEDMAGDIDHVFCPAGGGGLTLAVAKGVIAYHQKRKTLKVPAVHCVQPEGNNTIAGPLSKGLSNAVRLERSSTAISGLQVPGILDGNEVIEKCASTGGYGFVVADASVLGWQKALAMQEGIFCEPAGAVAVAGLHKAIQQKKTGQHDRMVCLITGSGFKDMNPVKSTFSLTDPRIMTVDQFNGHIRELMS